MAPESETGIHNATVNVDPKQVVSFEELLMFQVVQQEVLTRMLIEKGIFTKVEFLEMFKVVDREVKRNRG